MSVYTNQCKNVQSTTKVYGPRERALNCLSAKPSGAPPAVDRSAGPEMCLLVIRWHICYSVIRWQPIVSLLLSRKAFICSMTVTLLL